MATIDSIAKVVRDHWEKPLPSIRPREARPYIEGDQICDIIGPRRAGKTYLMFHTIEGLTQNIPREATIYINLEDRRLLPLRGGVLNDLVSFIHEEGLLERHQRIYLFLDEVKRVEKWERYVRSIYDEFKGRIKIFVSGSSAHLIGRECSRLLTGRHVTTQLLPLSFREYFAFMNMQDARGPLTERTQARIVKRLRTYLIDGGFPEVVLSKGNKDTLIGQLFDDIVARDIFSRPDVRNREVIDEFTRFLGANVSNLLSFGKMAKFFKSTGLKSTVPTLIKYFQHMKDAFLFFDNTIFSYSVRDRLQYPRKIYCIDNGLARMAGLGPEESWGALCENAVAVELLRRGERVNYWKGRNGYEVDFIIHHGTSVQPIQVCYDPSRFVTKERETRALVKCMEEFKVKEGTLVTFNDEGEERVDGKNIHLVPLWKFLLDRRVTGKARGRIGKK